MIRVLALAVLALPAACDGDADVGTGLPAGVPVGDVILEAGRRRLTDDVAYRDNGTNLDSEALPVPEPTAGVAP